MRVAAEKMADVTRLARNQLLPSINSFVREYYSWVGCREVFQEEAIARTMFVVVQPATIIIIQYRRSLTTVRTEAPKWKECRMVSALEKATALRVENSGWSITDTDWLSVNNSWLDRSIDRGSFDGLIGFKTYRDFYYRINIKPFLLFPTGINQPSLYRWKDVNGIISICITSKL